MKNVQTVIVVNAVNAAIVIGAAKDNKVNYDYTSTEKINQARTKRN